MAIERVLIAINVRWWNAEAAYALNLARGLAGRGVKVWLLVNPESPVHQKAIACNLPVIEDVLLDSMSPVQQLKNFRILRAHIAEKRIQLINSFKSNGAFLFSLLRRSESSLTYIKTRGVAIPPKEHAVNRYLYGRKSCDGIITTGSIVDRWMRKLLGKSANQQLATIYFGDAPVGDVDLAELSDRRKDFGIPVESCVFCLLGRTQDVKGHQQLLEALVELPDFDIHLLFLVKDPEEFPAELENMRRFISDNGLELKVTILGFQEDLQAVLSIVDYGVIPSLESEVNCRVCVEFFSMGIPVISFPTGTLPDIVRHRENGYLCSDHSVSELVNGISWALEHRKTGDSLQRQALLDYQSRFTLEVMTSETVRFWESCRSGSGRI